MAAATAPSGTPGPAASPARPASCSRHIGHRREPQLAASRPPRPGTPQPAPPTKPGSCRAGRDAPVSACPAPSRTQALLGERDPDEAFGEAIGGASALPTLERARTDLLYGEWLRRQRRRGDARPHMHAALELFQRLGAVPWADRAETELPATGETARKPDPFTAAGLTPRERQIAGLVADGLTNREIAAQLFLSARTIDYHLRKVFTRLGIASRTELVRDVLAQHPSA